MHSRFMLRKLRAQLGCSAILPDERPPYVSTTLAFPQHHRLPLIGDAYSRDPIRRTRNGLKGGLKRFKHALPNLLRFVLDPSGTRKMLRKLTACATKCAPLQIHKHNSGSGSSLIDRQDNLLCVGHETLNPFSQFLSHRSKDANVLRDQLFRHGAVLVRLIATETLANTARVSRRDLWGTRLTTSLVRDGAPDLVDS